MTDKKEKIIVSVIGARPQFIKAAPIEMAFSKFDNIKFYSIHTGQHYDQNMSEVFFDQLKLNKPYIQLQSGGKSHAKQTSEILNGMEDALIELKPDVLIVYGDTNSTIGASLAAAKLNIPIAHIEAGLRSFNRKMPEEVNRVLTDHVSSLLFVPSPLAIENLKHEGITNNVFLCGDVMKDIQKTVLESGLIPDNENKNFYYATIHRPYNTDEKERILSILDIFNKMDKKVIFAIHPRTKHLLIDTYKHELDYKNIEFIEPQGYFNNLSYLQACDCLITDSGGMQKEAYWFNKKCVTIRTETEWTETLENDCNHLVFENLNDIQGIINNSVPVFDNKLYGENNASALIAEKIIEYIG